MATPLKYMYNPFYFEKLCPVLHENIPGFDSRDFIFRIFNNQWPEFELKERVRHISIVLHHFLPKEFPRAARMLISIAGHLRQITGQQGFENIFLADYVEVYGLEHPDESLGALEEITKLVSAEFAVRPFILQHREKTMFHIYRWSRHSDANVRRLASEGCRPRLPWANALPDFKKDPSGILPVLEALKEDPSEYVRRSVANNLNDIAKDHPDLVLDLFKKWSGNNPLTDWILRHGCRSLLKNGHHQALLLHGFNPESRAGIRSLLHPARVNVGDYFTFSFDFVNREKDSAYFRLEYAIDYLTSTGRTSRKVFKLSERLFPPGKAVPIHRKQSFKDFSTRKHFRGKHQFRILANGKKIASTEFLVC